MIYLTKEQVISLENDQNFLTSMTPTVRKVFLDLIHDWKEMNGRTSGYFPIASLHRDDIAYQFQIPDEKANLITDEDMIEIAHKMGEIYVGYSDFWDSLEIIAREVIQDLEAIQDPHE